MFAEHQGYLADKVRIAKFRQAISASVCPNDTFADLGCGFGILGLLCLEAGAARGWGIDSSEAIEIAQETMERAGLAGRYNCLREESYTACLPEQVDLLVCDHVGYFGVDYGIIAMMADARQRLLKPGGQIIPQRIRLNLAAVTSPEARCMAEAWSVVDIPKEFGWLRQYAVNTKHGHEFAAQDIATDCIALDTIDLRSDNPDLLFCTERLTAIRDACLDGLAGWFDCELTEGVWMTNSPQSFERIDRPQVFLPFNNSIDVRAGEVIEVVLAVRHDTGLISWTVKTPDGRKQKQSTWASRIISPFDLKANTSKRLERCTRGVARKIVLDLLDGTRTASEIEQAVLRDHPDLLPTKAAIIRFVRRELARSAR